jgi:hypothetical protein
LAAISRHDGLHDAVEAYQVVVSQFRDAAWPAVLLDVVPARVNRPDGIADLSTDEVFVRRFTRSESDVSLALCNIKISVAGDELHMQTGITFVKAVEEAAGCDTRHGGLGTGEPDDALQVVL